MIDNVNDRYCYLTASYFPPVYYIMRDEGMSQPTANKKGNGNSIVVLGQYRINRDKALIRTTSLNFLNPAEDFIGIVECLGNIRHIEKKGDMKQDLDVVDCKIIVGLETREVEEETTDGTILRRKQIRYDNQAYSLVLSKAVLLSKFAQLQKELGNLQNRRIVIVGLGKVEDKNYFDYYVAVEERAKEEGILQIVSNA